jgi:hypothetical protein
MICGDLEVIFASLPDRDYLVAEVRLQGKQVAEVNGEAGYLQVHMYPRPDGREWTVSLVDLESALAYARSRLQPEDHSCFGER